MLPLATGKPGQLLFAVFDMFVTMCSIHYIFHCDKILVPFKILRIVTFIQFSVALPASIAIVLSLLCLQLFSDCEHLVETRVDFIAYG